MQTIQWIIKINHQENYFNLSLICNLGSSANYYELMLFSLPDSLLLKNKMSRISSEENNKDDVLFFWS